MNDIMNDKIFNANKLYLKTIKNATYLDFKIPTYIDYINHKQYYINILSTYVDHTLEFKEKKIINILNNSLFYKYLKYLFFNF